jgi:type II secretory pathway pseudopilin PulG
MMSTTGNRRSRAGELPAGVAFTLVELLLVMTLLTIVISISVPTLGNFFRGRSLDSEARRLLTLTRHGQSRAVSEGVPMMLWIDAKKRAYGLEEEGGYTDLDPKAVEFPLEKDLEIEVVNNNDNLNSQLVANANAQAKVAQSRSLHRNLPTIRFLPDGFVSEISPRALHLIGRDGESLFVAQSSNRLNYEIRSQLNWWNNTSR